MSTPIIRSTTHSVQIDGVGRNDLQIGVVITCADINSANVGHSYSWTFIDVPVGSSASITDHTNSTCHFTPDVTGSYFIMCQVDGASYSKEILAVPLPHSLARIPAFNEGVDYTGEGNLKGWHTTLTAFMRAVDSGGGGNLSSSYNAGLSSADQTITPTDSHGGAVIFDGDDVGLSDAYIVRASARSGHSFGILRSGGIDLGTNLNILIGVYGLPAFVDFATSMGNTVIGPAATTDLRSDTSTVIGINSYVGVDCADCISLGSSVSIYGGNTTCAALGTSIGVDSNYSVAIGDNIVVGSDRGVVIGSQSSIIGALNIYSTVIGSDNNLGNAPSGPAGYNVVIGNSIGGGTLAATTATATVLHADSSHFVNNDYVTYPDGAGGTIDVEMQVNDSFVPVPGRFTVDLRPYSLFDIVSCQPSLIVDHDWADMPIGGGSRIEVEFQRSAVGFVPVPGRHVVDISDLVDGVSGPIDVGRRFRDVWTSAGATAGGYGELSESIPDPDHFHMLFHGPAGEGLAVSHVADSNFSLGGPNTILFTAYEVGDAVAGVVAAHSTLHPYSGYPFSIGWATGIFYSTSGPSGNGLQIVSHVAAGETAFIGGTFSQGYNANSVFRSNLIGKSLTIRGFNTGVHVLGSDVTIEPASHEIVVLGEAHTIGTDILLAITMGTYTRIGDHSRRVTIMGHGDTFRTVSVGTSATNVFSAETTVGVNATDVIAIGISTIGDTCEQIVSLGSNSTTANTVVRSIAIGDSISLASIAWYATALGYHTSVTDAYGIAIGAFATASACECVIGDSTAGPVHALTVRGYNDTVGNVNTFKVIDRPTSSGDVGMFLVYNNGSICESKQVKAAITPPVGSLLLYLDAEA